MLKVFIYRYKGYRENNAESTVSAIFSRQKILLFDNLSLIIFSIIRHEELTNSKKFS